MSFEKLVFGRALPVIESLSGQSKYTFYQDLKDLPYRSSDEIVSSQWEGLKALVAHAYDAVPYYRRLFEDLGATPDDIRSPDDYAQIPTLTKDAIRQDLDSLVSEDPPQEGIFRNATGGSTGEPLSFYQHEVYRARSIARSMRSWSWAGWEPAEGLVHIWGASRETSPAKTIEGRLKLFVQRMVLLDAFSVSKAEYDRWRRVMIRYRPRFLNGYASALAEFSEYLLSSGESIHGVAGVFSTAEKLHENQRRTIESAFGTKVYDGYGSREVLTIAHECPEGNMHVISDSVYLETEADETGNRVVVTPLENFAMPMLRYENGDYVTLSDARCTCGIQFPLVEMDIGRVSDQFRFQGGKVIHGEYFTHLMYDVHGVVAFQFHQTHTDKIDLYLVTRTSFGVESQRQIDALSREISSEVGHEVELNAIFVDTIPRTKTGKHRFTLSDVTE